MKRLSLLALVVLLPIMAVTIAPVSAQDVTPTPTPPPPFAPCTEVSSTDPSAAPASVTCAHLIVKLTQPTALADFFVDGLLAASQVDSFDVMVTALHNHKIEARSITDVSANGVYQWSLSYPGYAYLSPGAERTLSLSLYKKYLMGFLRLTCTVIGALPEDGAACQPTIDENPAAPIAAGTSSVINLAPGTHKLVVSLAPEGTWYASIFQRTVSVNAGGTTYLTSSFTPQRVIPLLAGAGQMVTEKIRVDYPVSRVHLTHDGSSNFYVWVYDQNGKRDLLANEIGPYNGSAPLYKPGTYYFEIGADGNWTLKIEPLVQNNAISNGIDGTGDFVSDLFTPFTTGYVPYRFTHTGDRNFYVWLDCGGRRQLLQNEIGPVDNQAVAYFSGVSCFWVVGANGTWTIHPK